MISRSNAEEGFTLLEMVCILAVIAMVTAVVLPNISRNTSRPRLEATARTLRSGSTGQILRVPDDVVFDAILPSRCNDRPAFSTISFFPTGISCGGTVMLSRLGASYEIRVNWLTGGVEIVPRSAP